MGCKKSFIIIGYLHYSDDVQKLHDTKKYFLNLLSLPSTETPKHTTVGIHVLVMQAETGRRKLASNMKARRALPPPRSGPNTMVSASRKTA